MQRRVRVIGSKEMVDKLFDEIDQLPRSISTYKKSNPGTQFAPKVATLKLGDNTYSFENSTSFIANKLIYDLYIVCEKSDNDSLLVTLSNLAKKSIPFIPYLEGMTIQDIISELNNRHSGITDNVVISTEAITIEKTTTQKIAKATGEAVSKITSAASTSATNAAVAAGELATSVTHGVTLFAARIEAASAATPTAPDIYDSISNARL